MGDVVWVSALCLGELGDRTGEAGDAGRSRLRCLWVPPRRGELVERFVLPA